MALAEISATRLGPATNRIGVDEEGQSGLSRVRDLHGTPHTNPENAPSAATQSAPQPRMPRPESRW